MLLRRHLICGWGRTMQDVRAGRQIARRSVIRGMAAFGGAAFLAACGGKGASSTATSAGANASVATVSPGRQVSLAVTTTHLQDFMKNIGGDRVVVSGILKPN